MQQIGIITNDETQVFQKNVINGVRKCLEPHGYEVVVLSLTETKFEHTALVGFDGVVVIANVLSDDELQTIYQTGKPMTLVSHRVEGLLIPAVIQNNVDGIRHLVHYLVAKCGRRNIAFICGHMNQLDANERKQTFLQCMLAHDLIVPESHLLQGDFEPDVAADSVQKFINNGYDFDAIIAADYLMGIAALKVLQANSRCVPDDVCVVGFGDGQEAERYGLSTVAADVVEMGRRAACQLLAQLDGQRFAGVTWLSTKMIPRKTCRSMDESA